MARDILSWDETEETGLRLCSEKDRAALSPPTSVTACCWDTNSQGLVGLCSADGSFVVVDSQQEPTTASDSYAVYFNTLPVHLWGRRGPTDSNGQQQQPTTPPPAASAPARRVAHAWSQASFVPGRPGEVIFVQGRSYRVLWARLPKAGGRRTATAVASNLGRLGSPEVAAGGRFGLVDGSRVVALEGHRAQVRCLSMDDRGELLLTGDESGTICARLLHSSSPGDHEGSQDMGRRSREFGVGERSRGEGGGGRGGGGIAKVVDGAHAGGIQAISHVEGSYAEGSSNSAGDGIRDSSALFVSGGKGGVVRLWRATWPGRRSESVGAAAGTELQVELVNDMLVGGFQVSCLAASLSLQVPLVLAGTVEGTVFAFHLQQQEQPWNGTSHDDQGDSDEEGGGRGDGGVPGGASRAQVLRPDGKGGKAELGVLLMKFEHTRKSIEGVCCSQEQELFAAADADGIVRTYRPAPRQNAQDNPRENASTRDNASTASAVTVGGRRPSRPADHGEAIGPATSRRFELVVECRLGGRPALCEFAGGESRGPESGRGQEVLRTCTTSGRLRVWPTASLPDAPVRRAQQPQPQAPVPTTLGVEHEALAPLSQASSNAVGGDHGDGIDVGGSKTGGKAGERGQENRDPSDPFARWGSIAAEGRGVGGGSGAGRREGLEDEELVARGEPPVPKAHPAAARRVSFAPADEIYNLQDSYYSGAGRRDQEDGQESKEDEIDDYDEFEAPRPPPPAPTPMPATGAAGAPRSGQTRGGSNSRRSGSVGSGTDRRSSNGGFVDASSGAGGSGGYVAPSRLQEASLWSTAMEQAALERRMREGFDAGAVSEPTAPVYRAAAASAVNIPPTARTFEGLVSVSLDAPLPKPKRAGKQVSKSHLSKVQEQRITEEDLAFEGMEPDCSSIVGFGSADGRMWPHEEFEWYGGRSMFAELDRSSVASDRVWELGRRL